MSRQRRREQILEAAVELFSGKGYHATTMRDIAERLGLQAGSLYVHINSKEELLYEIIDRAADRFLRAVRAADAEAKERGAAPGERLRLAMRAHMRVMAENRATAIVFFHEWKFLDQERRRRVRAKRDTYEELFRAILREGMETGAFRHINVRLAGLALMSLCNWFYQWFSPEGPLSAEAIADQFAEFMLRGIERPRAPGGDDSRSPVQAGQPARKDGP
ncbi:MAG TPA: TetR/AcrR family transcriptional regulator [Bacillota bacterium]